MAFYADLHIHSKYSRATSKQCDLEHLALWAKKKGIAVVGTGDFTHPAWRGELQDKLVPAEPGLYRLRPDLERALASDLSPACNGITRFMLSVEISTIYKKGDYTRKIHHLIFVPDFHAADRVIASLSRIGNLASDGRPILGLDSRHLLEIVLESGADSYLVPAHIWTPWFAALGSKSGFDSIDDCYADLAPHIFAVETGLSSDPPMNWRVSALDRFRLVSNSDAHSPEKLGREACVFDTHLDYFSIRRALQTGEGYRGTVEFFPEEGKYHLDGHRHCHVRFSPRQTRACDGRCPVCGKPLTVGVMHRVEVLADRDDAVSPATAGTVQSLVPLPEILAELHQVGAKSKRVNQAYEGTLSRLGPELPLLTQVPLEDIRKATSALLAEAIDRLRRQDVIREAGFDGEYGTIHLFHADELRRHTAGAPLFDDAAITSAKPTPNHGAAAPPLPEAKQVLERDTPGAAQNGEAQLLDSRPKLCAPRVETQTGADDILSQLDADQRLAAEFDTGPLLIVAGPGSGKTRTLTHRAAHLIRHRKVPASQCLTITFTRRATDEMRHRLRRLLPDVWGQIPIFTFHALGLSILREHCNAAGLQRGFRVAGETECHALLRGALHLSEAQTRRARANLSRAKRTQAQDLDPPLATMLATYQQALAEHDLVDYDDLVRLAADILTSDAGLQAHYRQRYAWVSVDEYQDVDEQQVRLLKALVPPHGNICAIGDPDQAIYGFRGADVHFFERFQDNFPTAHVMRLTRNYRSDRNIVAASAQVIARTGSRPQAVAVRQTASTLITLHEAPTEKAEAEFVVQTLEHLLGGHSFFSIDSGRSVNPDTQNLSFSDFAVLYRTEAQRPPLQEALARSGMPFQQRSHALLLDHPGVSAFVEAWLAAGEPGPIRDHLTAWHSRLGREVEPDLPNAGQIAEAFDLLLPIASACGEDRERFLATLALEVQIDTWDPRADRIALLTLHAAKGLEFPVVFIVGCEAGILPLTWGGATAQDEAEERRLFYVGMTRAQTWLYLCRAQKRLWRGQVQSQQPSPYLTDLEAQLLAHHRTEHLASRTRQRDQQLDLF
jgi:DNA helicase-2/ATP-dependent DNA helicase PcrA